MRKILLVDVHESFLDSTRRYLQRADYEVWVGSDGMKPSDLQAQGSERPAILQALSPETKPSERKYISPSVAGQKFESKND